MEPDARNPSGLSFDITGTMRHENPRGLVYRERDLEAEVLARARRRAGIEKPPDTA